MTTTPRTVDQIRAIEDPEARIAAADAYIEVVEAQQKLARALRNDAIRALADKYGPSKAARMVGKSISYINSLRVP